ncbi:phosphotransferase [Streptomyces sp. NBC_01751]|uniref:phosphotransferase n=1 Tax=Streptomyces sp. NBC_01751 TaxID=2975929 RepID=UPI002DDA092B|nr:phosphotransferase [Streptomyces sp. NBC_01751]WSD25567.1 aminoglycoside phosphotransferase family protein [Streptomyces sp. NBC_01751]
MTALPVSVAAQPSDRAAAAQVPSARASEARMRAAALVPDESLLVGPLKGYHHETYAFPLPAGGSSTAQTWWKCRDPRAGLFWFDLRWFPSEKELVRALQGCITRIPAVVEREAVSLYTFIEGRTLGEICPPGRPLSARHVRQIGLLFRELVSVDPDRISRAGGPGQGRWPEGPGDDSTGFLMRLIHFTEHQVYRRHAPRYGSLFRELGLRDDGPDRLRRVGGGLTPRPFALIHGDLHRENFIVDPDGDLWTIDWELAMFGDPLYDLATHLHLMRYPAAEQGRIAAIWRDAVECARPGSSDGWERDLPVLLAYKRAQSVYTDVIRTALALGPGPEPQWRLLSQAARRIRKVLASAAEPLGLPRVPTVQEVGGAYVHWFDANRPA